MSNQVLREAENVVKIEGVVSEIRLEEKKGNGKEYITGEIDIKVNDDVHTINVYSNKINKQGKESGLYKGFLTIKSEYKSIATHGDAADKVRIDEGKIGLNEYVGHDGEIKSYPKLSANFINRLTANDPFSPKAKFILEMCVANVTEEKKQGEETGRALIKGYVPLYEGKPVIPFEVVVGEKNAVNYVTNHYEKGNTVTVYGDIVNNTTVTKKEVEVGFGKPQEQIKRTAVREFLIDGGSEPLEDDDKKALDPKLIKKGLADREAYHAQMKEKKKNAATSNNSNFPSSNKNNPFVDDGKPIDISDDDLPF